MRQSYVVRPKVCESYFAGQTVLQNIKATATERLGKDPDGSPGDGFGIEGANLSRKCNLYGTSVSLALLL